MVSSFDDKHINLLDYKHRNDWSVITENQTRLIIPSSSLIDTDPSKYPVFFNPEAKLNRDLSIFIYKNFIDTSKKRSIFVDCMSASGARGLRIGIEIPCIKQIYFNDMNNFAIQLSKINSVLNNVFHKCHFFNKEVCSFLANTFDSNNRATIVDLDPFGTPAPYIDCILRAVENEGMISVTATDTAVLEGVYPHVCFRKYYGMPIRTKYSTEIGSRIFLSSISLIASRLDLVISPIFIHSYRNYIRLYCKVVKSNSLANKNRNNLGYVSHCNKCGNREQYNIYPTSHCNFCNEKTVIAGPLWIKGIYEKSLLKKIVSNYRINKFTNDEKLKEKSDYYDFIYPFFFIAEDELDDLPFHFNNDEIGKLNRNSVFSLDKIIEKLTDKGYRASKTLFSSNGFKTNASLKEIREILV